MKNKNQKRISRLVARSEEAWLQDLIETRNAVCDRVYRISKEAEEVNDLIRRIHGIGFCGCGYRCSICPAEDICINRVKHHQAWTAFEEILETVNKEKRLQYGTCGLHRI